jgi:hypothetical protein
MQDEINTDKFSFDEWIDLVFDHEPAQSISQAWYWDNDLYFYGSKEHFVENCIKLFKNPEFLLERFTAEQLDEGFFGFILGPVNGMESWLCDKAESPELRREFIMSSVSVFEKLFTKNPLESSCFMWWDSLRNFQDDKDPKTAEWMFEALSQILKIDSLDCQKSALHGLGHLEPEGKKKLIEDFLANNPNFPEKEYALAAIEGKVL